MSGRDFLRPESYALKCDSTRSIRSYKSQIPIEAQFFNVFKIHPR
jgi:hypothetical protein